jgi:hypothetical protein
MSLSAESFFSRNLCCEPLNSVVRSLKGYCDPVVTSLFTYPLDMHFLLLLAYRYNHGELRRWLTMSFMSLLGDRVRVEVVEVSYRFFAVLISHHLGIHVE